MGKIQNSDDSLYQQDGKEVNINSNKQFTAQKEKKNRWLCIVMPTSNAYFKNILPADTQFLKKRQFNHLSQTEYTTFFLNTVLYFSIYFEGMTWIWWSERD